MLEHASDTTDPHAYHVSTYGAGQRGFLLRFRAVCACGWQSEPMPTAGLAHSAHDAHVADQTNQTTTTDS